MSRDAKKKDGSNELQKSPQSEILTMQVQMIPRNRGEKSYLRKNMTVQGELGLQRDINQRQKKLNRTMDKNNRQR